MYLEINRFQHVRFNVMHDGSRCRRRKKVGKRIEKKFRVFVILRCCVCEYICLELRTQGKKIIVSPSASPTLCRKVYKAFWQIYVQSCLQFELLHKSRVVSCSSIFRRKCFTLLSTTASCVLFISPLSSSSLLASSSSSHLFSMYRNIAQECCGIVEKKSRAKNIDDVTILTRLC